MIWRLWSYPMTEELLAESRLPLKPVTRLLAHCSDEAPLYFANGATDIDQKRGLALYGPADKSDLGPQTIRIGIVSSAEGLQQVTSWIRQFTERPIPATGLRPFIEQTFPGFLKAFHCRLLTSTDHNEELLNKEINQLVAIVNPNLRIKKAVELYASKVKNICRRVSRPDVIICHEPASVEERCGAGMSSWDKRKGALSAREKEEAEKIREAVRTHHVLLAPLDEDTKNMIEMVVNQDFRASLKAKCLDEPAPVQILTQTILEKMLNHEQQAHSKIGQDAATIAWNLAAAIYYKADHQPWRVGQLRQGTCYVGIRFYYDKTTSEKDMHASLAQIFSETGEGMVVRGDSFKWNVENEGEPRLSEGAAFDLLDNAINVYKQHHNNQPPNRVCIHKSSRYGSSEKRGFLRACSDVPKCDLVALAKRKDISFFRNGDNPVLRGTRIPLGSSYLVYTKGYNTFQRGYHKPRIPLAMEITQYYGDTSLDEIAKEILALTRLNWNTTDYCIYWPVTLEFSDHVGEILGRVPAGEPISEDYYKYM
jgi:hypothetical protein